MQNLTGCLRTYVYLAIFVLVFIVQAHHKEAIVNLVKVLVVFSILKSNFFKLDYAYGRICTKYLRYFFLAEYTIHTTCLYLRTQLEYRDQHPAYPMNSRQVSSNSCKFQWDYDSDQWTNLWCLSCKSLTKKVLIFLNIICKLKKAQLTRFLYMTVMWLLFVWSILYTCMILISSLFLFGILHVPNNL